MTLHATRIAVLEDDPSVRIAIGRLLRASHLAVESYPTCVELLGAVARFDPDCLILDLQMPGMTGIEVMEYLVQLGLRFPTIFITAHDEAGTRELCLERGALAYLCKPLDADELFEAIEAAASQKRTMGPSH